MAPALSGTASSPPLVSLTAESLSATSESSRNFVVQATRNTLGVIAWLAGQRKLVLPWSLLTLTKQQQLQLAHEYINVEVTLLTGSDIRLRVEANQHLSALKELITLQTGLPADRQLLVITEVKKRVQGLGGATRELVHAWKARKNFRSLVISLANFTLLPEIISREFSGRGLYSWAKGGLDERLQEASRASTTTLTLRVESLAGHVTRLELPEETSLAEMQQVVQQHTAIRLDRQHFAIEERVPLSRVDQVANQLLLASCLSLRLAAQMAGWAHSRFRLLYTPSSFPLQVTTASGQLTTVTASMDMSLAQVQKLAEDATAATSFTTPKGKHIQQIVFPVAPTSAGSSLVMR